MNIFDRKDDNRWPVGTLQFTRSYEESEKGRHQLQGMMVHSELACGFYVINGNGRGINWRYDFDAATRATKFHFLTVQLDFVCVFTRKKLVIGAIFFQWFILEKIKSPFDKVTRQRHSLLTGEKMFHLRTSKEEVLGGP